MSRWSVAPGTLVLIIAVVLGLLMIGLAMMWSPRDFLTRRLATYLIAGSETFNAPQQFWLRTGVVSEKEYSSPEYLVLQRRGWISASNAACTGTSGPPPCWEVRLTPLGIGVLRDWVPAKRAAAQYFSVPVARRQLVEVTGIVKEGNVADVDFQWKWNPLNEVGAALYSGGSEYISTAQFVHYDDGWRVVETGVRKGHQSLDDAMKNAAPTQ